MGVLAACTSPEPQGEFELDHFHQWTDTDPTYVAFPGDEVDVIVPSAPELSRTLIIAPDGRLYPAAIDPVLAADKSIPQIQVEVQNAYARILRDPGVNVTPRTFASNIIFVGGQVNEPGQFQLTGQIGLIEAIFLAGGHQDTARLHEVVHIRRRPGGAAMLRLVNVDAAVNGQGAFPDNLPLRRGDIVFVPRSYIAEVNLFIQQYIRDALPIAFGLTYDLAPNRFN